MERLDKLIANRLCISRRDAKGLIRKGLVLLNGAVVKSGEQKCGEGDSLVIEGKPVLLSEYAYIMLNKPAGVVCATRDNLSETVLELLPERLRRKGLFPAGRLDKDTEGFVLITDDGNLAHRILSPKKHVPKTYHVRLDAPVDVEQVAAVFAKGLDIGEGDVTKPARLRGLEDGLLELVISEGMYHQVKRMFAKVGRKVEYLKRVKMGGLELDTALAPGQCREITPSELELLEKGE